MIPNLCAVGFLEVLLAYVEQKSGHLDTRKWKSKVIKNERMLLAANSSMAGRVFQAGVTEVEGVNV
jgi:hypothetical protein